MEELKDFFLRNGAEEYLLWVDDYCFTYILPIDDVHIFSKYKGSFNINNLTLDRLKALIYGLTGKQLE